MISFLAFVVGDSWPGRQGWLKGYFLFEINQMVDKFLGFEGEVTTSHSFIGADISKAP